MVPQEVGARERGERWEGMAGDEGHLLVMFCGGVNLFAEVGEGMVRLKVRVGDLEILALLDSLRIWYRLCPDQLNTEPWTKNYTH